MNWRDIGDPLGGGAELHLHEILKHCVGQGHEVDLVVSAYAGAPAQQTLDGIHVHRKGHWAVANFVLPGLAKELLRRNTYDLLVEDINKVPFYSPRFSGGVPVLAIVPHLFGSTVFREANPLLASYVWAAERLIPRIYGQIPFEVISPSTRDDLIARGLPQDQVKTVYCGMDHGKFHLENPPVRSSTPLLVTWSRLRKYKSVDIAIRAFGIIHEQRPDARMLIIGRGPDEPRLRKLVRDLHLDDVIEFAGHLPWAELTDVLHRAHVFMNPSPKEGWGLTVIEANACGLPVVASDRPGLRDSVLHGETGLLVPYGDPAAMAAAVDRLLTDHAMWQTTSDAARDWARTFSWERCGRESLEIFQTAAGG